ncbi:MAG: methionine--tRNA ligase [Rhabdochlamydiaceae bacterium]
MKEKILITAALPYANGLLHFGHIAGAYLPADVYARFKRLKGSDVLYICGSDEHGVAITMSAEVAKRTPKEHVDLYHKEIQKFFNQMNISFDYYGRTTWEGHVETTQEFFKDLLANGYIESRVTDQLFSVKEQKFLADRYVIGHCPKCNYNEARGDECPKCGANFEATDLISPRSKLTDSPLILKPTQHWFLRFDLFKERLQNWIKDKPWKSNVLNFAKNYIDDLKPRAITRDSDWGIAVPLEEAKGKVFYVWFDAPIGYISATRQWAASLGKEDRWKDYWLDTKTKYVQFIGKDNIPFHAVFFPAMTMGQNQPYKLVDEIPANEFYTLEGKQFSKSDGWIIDLDGFFERYTEDQLRYCIAANAPESQDAEFTWKDFQQKCNGDLVGKLGNFINRVLVFVKQNLQGCVPQKIDLLEKDFSFLDSAQRLLTQIEEAYDHFQLRKASQLIMELAQQGNVYFDFKKPWRSIKSKEDYPDMIRTIHVCLDVIKILALVCYPIMPNSALKIWALMGFPEALNALSWKDASSCSFVSGQILPEPQVIFPKIEEEMINQEISKLNGLPKKKTVEPLKEIKNLINIEDIRKIDLRVGLVLEAEKIPKSQKLLKLQVDIGIEKRVIVAGLGDKIQDVSALKGKKVMVVCNLAPTTFMGVESQGMILLANQDKNIILPDFVDASPGDKIY